MDKQELMEKIRASNESYSKRVFSEWHDFQYDCDADILYLAIGAQGEAFSVPLDTLGEQVYLRIDPDTYKIVGLDIMCFRKSFLANDPDASRAFEPLFNFLGNSDWRIQVRLPDEVSLLLPAQAPVEYLGSYIPKAVPSLATA